MPEQMIGNGIRYTEICDPKFRSCMLLLRFYMPRDAQTAPVHALLTDQLTASSAAYPGLSALSRRLDALYAADFSGRLMLCGDAAALSFSASWLDDRFALEQEDLTGEMLELVTGCLLKPNLTDGGFSEPEFRRDASSRSLIMTVSRSASSSITVRDSLMIWSSQSASSRFSVEA